MNQDMHEIYRLLYSDYTETPFSPDLGSPSRDRPVRDGVLPRITAMIEDAERRTKAPHRLRPDARLFLVVNFHQMVSRPLQLGNVLPDEQLLQLIHHDLRIVVEDAANEDDADAVTPSRDGISAAAVVRAIARRWKELKLNGIGVWRD